MTDIFIKGGNLDTDMKKWITPCEHEDRDQDDGLQAKKHQRLLIKNWSYQEDLGQVLPHSPQKG